MSKLIFLGLFTSVFFIEVISDLQAHVPLIHIWHEILLFVISFIALIWQFSIILRREKEMKTLTGELLQIKDSWQKYKEINETNARAVRMNIEHQLDEWNLSEGEKDIALLLVKGLSMKEIAILRNTHERTVRQQASNIYRKAGLTSRQELSAFFLEDILSSHNH